MRRRRQEKIHALVRAARSVRQARDKEAARCARELFDRLITHHSRLSQPVGMDRDQCDRVQKPFFCWMERRPAVTLVSMPSPVSQ